MPATFLVLCDYGARGKEWRPAEPGYSRDDVIADLMGGQIDRPAQILELDPDREFKAIVSPVVTRYGCLVDVSIYGSIFRWCRDVTTEIAREVIRRLMTEDRTAPECIHEFLDTHYVGRAA